MERKLKGNAKTIEILMETERVADKVLQIKTELVELDKRRQDTRIALRELGKNNEKKAWITIGPLLVKMEKEKAMALLRKDQQTIEIESNKLRSDQKTWVAKLRDLEYLSPIVGFNLKPLDRKEVDALRTNLPIF